jgi:hypothetical protein
MKSPIATVKEKFGDKAKLVTALESLTGEALWLGRVNADKGLAHVSNAKLLRLHAVFTEVKEKFGTRAKLVSAILEVEKRTKDAGYQTHIEAWPVPRLYDHYKAAAKRAKTAEKPAAKAKPKAEKKAEKPATKPAAAKAKAGKK